MYWKWKRSSCLSCKLAIRKRKESNMKVMPSKPRLRRGMFSTYKTTLTKWLRQYNFVACNWKASSLPIGGIDTGWREAASEVTECSLGRKISQDLQDTLEHGLGLLLALAADFTLSLFLLFIGYKMSVATIAMRFENVFFRLYDIFQVINYI